MSQKKKTLITRLTPVLWVSLILALIIWAIVQGQSVLSSPFLRTEVTPGISGLTIEPPKGSPLVSAVVLLPGADGWTESWAERSKALAAEGRAVVVLDYYQGGRDSYHGHPHESDQDLIDRWKANITRGLAWVRQNNRGLPWTLITTSGRAAELLEGLDLTGFTLALEEEKPTR